MKSRYITPLSPYLMNKGESILSKTLRFMILLKITCPGLL
ncbi:hypothetical protein BANRA_03556 [Escherichia coli]|nr:hypothetical protein BANRA_03556 [Escherichia coli]